MKTIPSPHPSKDQLAAFGLGRLAEPDRLRVEQHVADCASCCDALRHTPRDTLLKLAQDAALGETRAPGAELTPPGFAAPPLNLPPELRDHPRYRVLGLLGCGGMGAVYKAEHLLMGRTVALKVINRELLRGHSPDAVKRFLQEVKAAARLEHPNIVTAHDADQTSELHFLVMEHVEGVSLSRLVEKKGPVSVAHACHFIRQAALGLQHAFEKGMVHRDVKPQNLMVTKKGLVKILDFGLARFARGQTADVSDPVGLPLPGAGGGHDTAPLTTPGLVLGTPDYIAPEQARDSGAADVRCDIYSLGCTLYFLLAGRVPFGGDGPYEKLLAHLQETARPLDEVRKDVPPELAALVQQMMAKSPADRPQTPAEVAKALAPFVRSESPSISVEVPEPVPMPISEPATLARKAKRTQRLKGRPPVAAAWWKPVVIAGVVGLVLAGGFLAAWAGWKALQPGGTHGGTTQPTNPFVGGVSAKGKRVLVVLPSQGYYVPDYQPVEQILTEGGVDLTIAAVRPGKATPWEASKHVGKEVPIDVTLDQVKPADYDAFVLIGGNMDDFGSFANKNRPDLDEYTMDQGARNFIEKLAGSGKPVAAICRGIVLLTHAEVLPPGKQIAWSPELNSWSKPTVKLVHKPVVVDGRIITAKDPEAAKEFARKLLNVLETSR